MLKAALPSPPPPAGGWRGRVHERAPGGAKAGAACRAAARVRVAGSCFHSATMTLSTIVSTAAPWITWISLTC
jgi:hypothetical protein